MYTFLCSPFNAVTVGLAVTGYAVGALGAFSVYKFASMSPALMLLAFQIGQLFFMLVFFSYYKPSPCNCRSIRVNVEGSPNPSPQDSPQREGLRRSQELSAPKPAESVTVM